MDTPNYPYRLSLSNELPLPRDAHMEARLSNLERSASGHPQQYHLQEKDPQCHPFFFPQVTQTDNRGLPLYVGRGASPNGSYGGERSVTETDSPPSERSWGHHVNNPYGQSEFGNSPNAFSPSHYPDPLGHQVAGEARRPYCSSENSVSLRELQRIPDPEPDTEPSYEEGPSPQDDPADNPAYLHHPVLGVKRPNGYVGGEMGAHTSYEMNSSHEEYLETTDANRQGSTVIPDYTPRKRMKYSAQTGHSSRSSTTANPRRANGNKSGNNKSRGGAPTGPNRAGKRGNRRVPAKGSSSSRNHQADSGRLFICCFSHYGCKSTFCSKNEWKRHVASQHLQLGFYRCDVGFCNVSKSQPYSASTTAASHVPFTPRSPNDFNRKDLFTQHQRRMHAPWSSSPGSQNPTKEERDRFEDSLEEVRGRCWITRRQAPQRSICGFCEREFAGAQCWDERMEHVGKHFEKGDTHAREDVALREWAIREDVIRAVGKDRWLLSSLRDAAVQDHRGPGVEDDRA